jgi:hypothetical protein
VPMRGRCCKTPRTADFSIGLLGTGHWTPNWTPTLPDTLLIASRNVSFAGLSSSRRSRRKVEPGVFGGPPGRGLPARPSGALGLAARRRWRRRAA